MIDRSFIPKRSRPFSADKGPWLIWSHKWHCWHRRSEDGGACGYTNDILSAGIFDVEKASAYHDTGPRRLRDNVSIPAHKAIKAMEHALAEKKAECAVFAQKVEQLRASLTDRRIGA